MNWAWASQWLDEAWRAPAFPLWATLIAAGAVALVVLIVLIRAEPSTGSAALAVVALLAVAVATVTTLRDLSLSRAALPASAAPQPAWTAPAALACLDELAGGAVLNACERALFGSPDRAAAAVSHAAARIAWLSALRGPAAEAAEANALRAVLQRDRYGLVAQVLTARDGCKPTDCPLLGLFSDPRRIVANMTDDTFAAVIRRNMPAWSEAAPSEGAAAAAVPIVGLPPSLPTGRPTTMDFPTSDAIPPVSIMNTEPASAASAARVPTPQPRPAPPAAKRHPQNVPVAPVQLAPAAPGGQ